MIYKFTKSSERVIELSSDIAIKLGHNYIGTEHLLYGLTKEKSGIASRALQKQNINEKNVLDKIEEMIGKNTYIQVYTVRIYSSFKKGNRERI